MSAVGDIVGGSITDEGVYVNEVVAKDDSTVTITVIFYANDHSEYEAKKSAVEAINNG